MKSVCLFFNVHLPFRLRAYQPEDINVVHTYADTSANLAALDIAAEQCFLPANEILLRLLMENEGRFAVNFSVSGTLLQLMQEHRPDVLASFRKLVNTGRVEILAETYYNSLSFLYSGHEFRRQVQMHSDLAGELFGKRPAVFRNTELIYSDDLARVITGMGYTGIICEGAEKLLQGRSPDHVYHSAGNERARLLLRNQPLSDDIAFRFNDSNWPEHPLTAAKYASWLHAGPEDSEVINLFMDYSTFGMYKQADTGIFRFLEELPGAILGNDQFIFSTATEALNNYSPRGICRVPQPVSWESRQDYSSLCCINSMQHNTRRKIYDIENMVMGCRNNALIETWGVLQAADHFYNMTDTGADILQKYGQNPFRNAADACRNYTNILVDFEISVIRENIGLNRQKAGHYRPEYTLY